MAGVVCAWLRNDLRVHDSPVLHRAVALARQRNARALPVYVLDPRHFQRTRHGQLKTGAFRALFLLQSLRCLRQKLRAIGSDLLVRVGKPEEVLPALLPSGSVLLTQEEVTTEEKKLDRSVRDVLGKTVEWEYCWGSTLFHRDDLPFKKDLSDAPDVFTTFKNKVEPELSARCNEVPDAFQGGGKRAKSRMGVRPCLPDPEAGSLPVPDGVAKGELELAWSDLPYTEAVQEPTFVEGSVLQFEGGEDAGLARLKYYLWDTDLVATYKDTRNGMIGGDYSTKLAPWFALGCVSVRKVFEQIRAYEKQRVSNESTYWVLFELMWRDFFRFFAAKHGARIFQVGGLVGSRQKWSSDAEEFDLWATGRTGFPLVDANMRELQATGFMSNRGRQNVASFLALHMKHDWRKGADLFESLLLDYDVTSNWGNWVMAAGVTTGRVNYFNVIRQSKSYDSDGAYLKHWLPELKEVPGRLIHEPWKMSDADKRKFGAQAYPEPMLNPTVFGDGSKGDGKGAKGAKGAGAGKGKGNDSGKGYDSGKSSGKYQKVESDKSRRWGRAIGA